MIGQEKRRSEWQPQAILVVERIYPLRHHPTEERGKGERGRREREGREGEREERGKGERGGERVRRKKRKGELR